MDEKFEKQVIFEDPTSEVFHVFTRKEDNSRDSVAIVNHDKIENKFTVYQKIVKSADSKEELETLLQGILTIRNVASGLKSWLSMQGS